MRIALLGHSLRAAGGLSVGRNIISSLPRIAPQHQYLATVPAGVGYEDLAIPNVTMEVVPSMGLARRIRFEHCELPGLVRDFRPDWIWGLGNTGLMDPPCHQAILFQDSHLVYPARHFVLESWSNRLKKRLIRRHLRRCLKRTDVVFCQTQTAQRRFAQVMRYTGRLALCPNAVSAFATIPVRPQMPQPLGRYGERFRLLLLTKYYPHKNIEGLVAAYERFEEELRDTLCVITIEPSQHPLAGPLLDRIRHKGLQDRILNVGPLKQEQLAEYYLGCNGLLLPTLLESFSGTYLEAMHFGRPILTSDLDFAHDVCEDAALYFDPWDPPAIKETILRLKNDPALQADLVCRGRVRLERMFRSWPDILRSVADELGISHD